MQLLEVSDAVRLL